MPTKTERSPWTCFKSIDDEPTLANPMFSSIQNGEYFKSPQAEPYEEQDDFLWKHMSCQPSKPTVMRRLKSFDFSLLQFQRSSKEGHLDLQGIDNLGYNPDLETPVCDRTYDGLYCPCSESDPGPEPPEIVCDREFQGQACQCSKESNLPSSQLGRSIRDTTGKIGDRVTIKTNELWRHSSRFASIRRRRPKKSPKYHQETLVPNPVIYPSVLQNYDLGFRNPPEHLLTPDGIETAI